MSAEKHQEDPLTLTIQEQNPEALTADGFDDAIIGLAYRAGSEPLVAYSTSQCIQVLMDRDGMTYDEAVEYFNFNVVDAYMGEGTPIFIRQKDEFLAF
jgi:hypothetical protein